LKALEALLGESMLLTPLLDTRIGVSVAMKDVRNSCFYTQGFSVLAAHHFILF
jgi:hypothetical protein